MSGPAKLGELGTRSQGRAGRWLKNWHGRWAGMEISLPSETSEISIKVGKERVKKTQIEQSADLLAFQVSARLRTLSLLFIPSRSPSQPAAALKNHQL